MKKPSTKLNSIKPPNNREDFSPVPIQSRAYPVGVFVNLFLHLELQYRGDGDSSLHPSYPLLLRHLPLLSEELLVASVEDVVFLVGQEAVLCEIILVRLGGEVDKVVFDGRSGRFGRWGGLMVDAGDGRFLLEGGEDHLALLEIFLLNDLFLDDRGWTLDEDVAPESVAELVSVGAGEAPVGDDLARLVGGPHQDSEAVLLAWGNLGVAGGALGSADKLMYAGGVLWVNSAHVVAANKLDGASCWPGLGAAVAKDPGLLKDRAGSKYSSIWYCITDKGSDELAIGLHSSLLRLKLLGRLFGLNFNFLSLDLSSWLNLSNGLDLSSSIRRRTSVCLGGLGDGTAAAVTHHWHGLAIVMVAHRRNANIADRGLELDKRVGPVVDVGWAGLAAGTEISVIADSALIAVAADVQRLRGTQRPITVNTVVESGIRNRACVVDNRLVDRDEAVAWVDELRIWNAGLAVVPVWAVKALVTNTIDVLVTTITDSLVRNIASRVEKCLGKGLQFGVRRCWCKRMLWVVAMLDLVMAWNAEIKVITIHASDETVLWVF